MRAGVRCSDRYTCGSFPGHFGLTRRGYVDEPKGVSGLPSFVQFILRTGRRNPHHWLSVHHPSLSNLLSLSFHNCSLSGPKAFLEHLWITFPVLSSCSGVFSSPQNLSPHVHIQHPPPQKPPPSHISTMSDTQQKPWSNSLNAPKIPYDLYYAEKATIAGILIALVLYGTFVHSHPLRVPLSALNSVVPGILVVLFFQCMGALLSSANRNREGVNWGLVSYTVVMFSCATVVNGWAQYFASISFIDNRNFPGVEGAAPPGPFGYQQTICSTTVGTSPTFASSLSYWLADGLLVGCLIDRAPVFPS